MALLPIAGWSFVRYRTNDLDQRTALFEGEATRLKAEQAKLKPLLDRHRALKSWVDESIPWQNELNDLATAFPDTTQAYLNRIEVTGPTANTPSAVKLQGRSTSAKTILDLQSEWAKQEWEHYRVEPRVLQPISGLGISVGALPSTCVRALENEQYQAHRKTWEDRDPSIPDGMARMDAPLTSAKKQKSTPAKASSVKKTK